MAKRLAVIVFLVLVLLMIAAPQQRSVWRALSPDQASTSIPSASCSLTINDLPNDGVFEDLPENDVISTLSFEIRNSLKQIDKKDITLHFDGLELRNQVDKGITVHNLPGGKATVVTSIILSSHSFGKGNHTLGVQVRCEPDGAQTVTRQIDFSVETGPDEPGLFTLERQDFVLPAPIIHDRAPLQTQSHGNTIASTMATCAIKFKIVVPFGYTLTSPGNSPDYDHTLSVAEAKAASTRSLLTMAAQTINSQLTQHNFANIQFIDTGEILQPIIVGMEPSGVTMFTHTDEATPDISTSLPGFTDAALIALNQGLGISPDILPILAINAFLQNDLSFEENVCGRAYIRNGFFAYKESLIYPHWTSNCGGVQYHQKTLAHEFGHIAGLEHFLGGANLMTVTEAGFGTSYTAIEKNQGMAIAAHICPGLLSWKTIYGANFVNTGWTGPDYKCDNGRIGKDEWCENNTRAFEDSGFENTHCPNPQKSIPDQTHPGFCQSDTCRCPILLSPNISLGSGPGPATPPTKQSSGGSSQGGGGTGAGGACSLTLPGSSGLSCAAGICDNPTDECVSGATACMCKRISCKGEAGVLGDHCSETGNCQSGTYCRIADCKCWGDTEPTPTPSPTHTPTPSPSPSPAASPLHPPPGGVAPGAGGGNSPATPTPTGSTGWSPTPTITAYPTSTLPPEPPIRTGDH